MSAGELEAQNIRNFGLLISYMSYLRCRDRPTAEHSYGVRFVPHCFCYNGVDRDLKEPNLYNDTGRVGVGHMWMISGGQFVAGSFSGAIEKVQLQANLEVATSTVVNKYAHIKPSNIIPYRLKVVPVVDVDIATP